MVSAILPDTLMLSRSIFLSPFLAMKAFALLCALTALSSMACSSLSKREREDMYAAAGQAEKTGVCHVHHCPMQRKTVPIAYGLMVPDGSEPSFETRGRRFPFADEEWVPGGCMVEAKKTEQIFVCSECQKAKQHWIKMHPFSRWAREQKGKTESDS